MFTFPFLTRSVKIYKIGDIAEETVISNQHIKTIDIEETEKKKDTLRKTIPPVVDIDLTHIESNIKLFTEIFLKIPENNAEEEKLKFNQYLEKNNFSTIDNDSLSILIRLKSDKLKELSIQFITHILKNGVYFGLISELTNNNSRDLNVRQIMNTPNGSTEITYMKIASDKIIQYPLQIGEVIKIANSFLPGLNSEIIHVLSLLSLIVIKPNVTINQLMTEQNINQILSRVNPVYVEIETGETIIEKRKEIKAENIKKLRYYRKFVKEKKFNFFNVIGVMLFLCLFTGLIIIYLNHTHKDELKIFRNFLLIYFFLIANAIILHIIFKATSGDTLHLVTGLLVPIGITSICISILINNETSMSINFALTFIFIVGLLLTGMDNFITIFIFLCSGGVASFAVKNIKKKTTIFKAGLLIGISNFILISAYALIYQTNTSLWYKSSAIGFINGIACAIVATGIMPFFENILKIPTPFKLIELTDLNTKILKEMLIEAPGTYHHSLMVANLAEAAAESIGSNALLARVGSIYHDIGKTENPRYFIENLMNEENPHEKLQPSLSASIIKTHVKEGIEKAKQLKLPDEIIDFIRQHHGTTVIRYFFEKAKVKAMENKDINEISVDISEYSYEGPNPQTKETAIVMLADSVEAASKTLQNPSPVRIKQLINDIISTKLLNDELSESNLTLNEIRKISFAFYQILAGVFHTRVEYPTSQSQSKKIDKSDNLKGQEDDNRNKQSDTENGNKQKKLMEIVKLILKILDKDINISILICGEIFIKSLNNKYRKKDKPTDVLTFIYDDNTQNTASDSFFGEIIICPSYAKKNAKNFENDYNTEIKRILIHGILHLVGYDHEKSVSEEKEMFSKQEELLKLVEDIKVC